MRNRRILIVLAVLLFLVGLAVALRPVYRTAIQNAEDLQRIQEFQEYVQEHAKENSQHIPITSSIVDTPAEELAFPDLWDACLKYNQRVWENGQRDLTSYTLQLPAIDLVAYGWELDTFGYLSIPAVNIEAPLYLGASVENLSKGGTILGQTSLPIGGENTHAVIAGHRTQNAAAQFKGLDLLQPSDLVYVTNPWETLTYEVIQIQVIQPNESEKIRIQEGRDLLSIFTCTYPNTARVLVTCEHMDNQSVE